MIFIICRFSFIFEASNRNSIKYLGEKTLGALERRGKVKSTLLFLFSFKKKIKIKFGRDNFVFRGDFYFAGGGGKSGSSIPKKVPCRSSG